MGKRRIEYKEEDDEEEHWKKQDTKGLTCDALLQCAAYLLLRRKHHLLDHSELSSS